MAADTGSFVVSSDYINGSAADSDGSLEEEGNNNSSESEYVPSGGEIESDDDALAQFSDAGEKIVQEDELEAKTNKVVTKIRKRPLRSQTNRTQRVPTVRDDGEDKAYRKRLETLIKNKLIEDHAKILEGCDPELPTVFQISDDLSILSETWNMLYDYQKAGLRWLWKLHEEDVGGILGDEMGLGKTIQIIAFLSALTHPRIISSTADNRFGNGMVLLVCPATLLHQWVREFHAWAPRFRVAVLHESGAFKGSKASLLQRMQLATNAVIVTSYSTLTVEIKLLKKYSWDYVILDEGQKIRNPDAQVTLAVKSISTPHRIILTGSPIQNSLKELWSLFDFVFPGRLGTLPVFMQEFAVPITHGGYANATTVQVHTAYKCACLLREIISPYLLRRMKKDVQGTLHLPHKSEQVLFCRITDEQRKLYENYILSRVCADIVRGSMAALVGLTALRQLCNHPDIFINRTLHKNGDVAQETATVLDQFDDSSQEAHKKVVEEADRKQKRQKQLTTLAQQDWDWRRSGKMCVVRILLQLWKKQGHRVLLFSQSVKMLNLLEHFLRTEDYCFLRMDGDTTISQRQPLVQLFNSDSSYFVFLLSTRVGGLGLNLIGADRVLIYDPDWNPATDSQALERAWRIGQSQPVTVYRLITSGTVEEKIYQRQIFKHFLTNRVLKDPKQRRFFKTCDLHELFTLDGENGKSSVKPETAELFAGTGSEVKVKKGKKRKRHSTYTVSSPNVDISQDKKDRLRELAKLLSKRMKPNDATETEEMNGPDLFAETVAVDNTNLSTTISLEKNDGQMASWSSTNVEGEEIPFVLRSEAYRPPVAIPEDEQSSTDPAPQVQRSKSKIQRDSDFEEQESKSSDQLSRKQDDYVLRKLFKKAAVQTALKHDKVTESASADLSLAEAEAERVAAVAAKSLQRSRRYCPQPGTGIATWTGRHGLKPKKSLFGQKILNNFGHVTPKAQQRSADSSGPSGFTCCAENGSVNASTTFVSKASAKKISGKEESQLGFSDLFGAPLNFKKDAKERVTGSQKKRPSGSNSLNTGNLPNKPPANHKASSKTTANQKLPNHNGFDEQLCSNNTASASSSIIDVAPLSSASILARIRERKALELRQPPAADPAGDSSGQLEAAGETSSDSDIYEDGEMFAISGSNEDEATTQQLLRSIQEFIFELGQATTHEIVQRFQDRIAPEKRALFKSLLKQICDKRKLTLTASSTSSYYVWRLKPQFSTL